MEVIFKILSVLATIISSLCAASIVKKTIKNKVKSKAISNSTIYQAENISIVNNGLDTYAVVKIAKDTTQEELENVILKINEIEKEANRGNKIFTSEDAPQDLKVGDLWIQPVKRIVEDK